jgi:hypothetical protein
MPPKTDKSPQEILDKMKAEERESVPSSLSAWVKAKNKARKAKKSK